MARACFVTATGTDVGKTFVMCELIAAARRRALPVRALKPVMSGFDAGTLADSDAGRLLAALGQPVEPRTLAQISPWRFTAPLSPDMAAAREGRQIDAAALNALCRREIDRARRDGAVVLIEGVGGVAVPLDERHTVLDWIHAVAAPAVLVAGSYLGTLSHTLTAFAALRERGIRVAAVVVSESAESPVPLAETVAALERFVAQAPVLALRRRREASRAPSAPDGLQAASARDVCSGANGVNGGANEDIERVLDTLLELPSLDHPSHRG